LHSNLEIDGRLWSDKRALGTIESLPPWCVRTLRRSPALNATFDGDVHHMYDEVNLGIAVAATRGLMALLFATPVSCR